MRVDLTDEPRPEIELTDFVLSEFYRLMARLDEIKNGTIERLEVRGGLPRRMIFQSPLTEAMR